jgi:ADP-heptose:LPS heptosyltransferase
LAKPRHVLVFRFSSLGDVAMTIPVMQQVLKEYPELVLTFVSNAKFEPLFRKIPRLRFFPVKLDEHYKGFAGLYRLFRVLRKQVKSDAVADLHQSLRTRILRFFFFFTSMRVAILDKGKVEKKLLTRKKNKILKPLMKMHERYAAVFADLGLPVTLKQELVRPALSSSAATAGSKIRSIGIAPFAKHDEKTFPPEKMKEVIRQLSSSGNVNIFLFGAKGKESETLAGWEKELKGVVSYAGSMDLEEELRHISGLDLMISMDSANMHLASLAGVPVVSIWGATHPYLGFMGWGQSLDNAVFVDLFCRPCSVFGNVPCYRQNLECMMIIEPDMIVRKIKQLLDKS